MSPAITPSIDVAQLVLYGFWIFFFGLIYWLRKEDRREGYPLESDNPRRIGPNNQILIPTPKTFKLPEGGTYSAPDFKRDTREFPIERTAAAGGAPLEPTGDPMLSGVGPAAYAKRHDAPELTRDGRDQVIPMRTDPAVTVLAGPDPRGWDVVGGDGKVAGTVKDIWIDRADVMVRYLEVELAPGAGATGTRLIPMPLLQLRRDSKRVEVSAILSKHFAQVPVLKNPDRVTVMEEELVSAFYAGGKLYAEPRRLGPLL
ncbi:MAG: photosynthetic reaction center subunit H [Myxococcales bacterium]|nr:photosynthetic reaction center subunit H [Myxococcales bacterium]